MKAFSFKTDKGILQIGVEFENAFYNFSQAWELYKEIKNNGRGPSLGFLQVMVEADFFRLETLQEVLDTLKQVRPLSELEIKGTYTFEPPIGRPQKILCIGRNYKGHAAELENEIPEEPLFFSKAPSAIIPHHEVIRRPKDVGKIDFEGELTVVVGKQAHNISQSKAMDYVAGFSILNDVTARELQKSDIKAGKPWFRSKSFDTFCPFGPFLVPKEAVQNYNNLELEVTVNGDRKQHASTSQMIFKVEEIVAYISKFCTLQPGDLIATGTPAGVGELHAGDIVECRINEIGSLKNGVE